MVNPNDLALKKGTQQLMKEPVKGQIAASVFSGELKPAIKLTTVSYI